MFAIFVAMMAVSFAFAIWKGGAPERLCAWVILLMAVAQYVGFALIGRVFKTLDVVSLSVDLIGLVGMTAIALHANRTWPLWTSAMQLLSCASHLGRDISDRVEPLVYSILKSAPTFLVFLILMIGTAMHQLRLRKLGQDTDWVGSVPLGDWHQRIPGS